MQEARKAEEEHRAAAEAERVAEEAAALEREAAAATARAAATAAGSTAEGAATAAGATQQPALPINPFFLQRKQGAGASSGAAGEEGTRANVGTRKLKEAMAPIHITQLPHAAQPAHAVIHAGDVQMTDMTASGPGSSTGEVCGTVTLSHVHAPAIPLASLLRPVGTASVKPQETDGGICGFKWLQQQATGVSTGAAAGTVAAARDSAAGAAAASTAVSVGGFAPGSGGSLLEQLAQRLAQESHTAMGGQDKHVSGRADPCWLQSLEPFPVPLFACPPVAFHSSLLRQCIPTPFLTCVPCT